MTRTLRARPLSWLACLAAGLVASAQAAEPSRPGGEPLWEVGAFAFGISQQAYPGSDQQVQRALALPFGVYRGRFLRADRETAGLRALRTERLELDIGFSGSFGSNAEDIQARSGMRRLGTLVEFGPRLKVDLGEALGGRWRLDVPLRGVFDLDDGLARRGLAFEPRLLHQRRLGEAWFASAGFGPLVADEPLARVFYQVDAADARIDRPAYAARAGLVAWRLQATLAHEIDADWRVFGFARVDSLAGAANRDSPLVRRTTGASVGIGLAWVGWRSQARAFD